MSGHHAVERNKLCCALPRVVGEWKSHQINKHTKMSSVFRSTFSSRKKKHRIIDNSPGCWRLLGIAILIIFTFGLAKNGKRLGDFRQPQVRLADAPAEVVAHGAVVVVRLHHRLHRVRQLR